MESENTEQDGDDSELKWLHVIIEVAEVAEEHKFSVQRRNYDLTGYFFQKDLGYVGIPNIIWVSEELRLITWETANGRQLH